MTRCTGIETGHTNQYDEQSKCFFFSRVIQSIVFKPASMPIRSASNPLFPAAIQRQVNGFEATDRRGHASDHKVAVRNHKLLSQKNTTQMGHP